MMKKNAALFVLLIALAGCTFTKPPSYDLPKADGIYKGQQITVRPEENLYAVSQRYGVRLRELIVINQMQPPYRVTAGDRLYLPSRDPNVAPRPRAAPLASIERGSDLTSRVEAPLSSSKVESQPLADSPIETRVIPEKKTRTNIQRNPNRRAATDVKELDIKALRAKIEGEKEKKEAEAKTVQEKQTAPRVRKSDFSGPVPVFAWPVRGTIISAFGPKGKGRDNDGINIVAPKGSPVKAAAGGVVAYAGNEMKGFGNLVLIRHPKGWVTAYAHLERMLVRKDQRVQEGDMLGTIGTTGGVSTPQTHFEIRRDGKPVDPELLLK